MTVISSQCDGCNKMFPVDQLIWSADGRALCDDCLEVQEVEEVPLHTRVPPYAPVYFFHDGDDRLLHITTDFDSPRMWKPIQGPNWWWFNVASVAVKFFPSPQEAEYACKKLTTALAPIYVKIHDVVDRPPEPDVHSLKVESDLSLSTVLNVRVSDEAARKVRLHTARLGVPTSDWLRSLLYHEIRNLDSQDR